MQQLGQQWRLKIPETFKWRLKWNHLPYRVVFEKGFDAQFVYGAMNYNGKGCTANRTEGILWVKKAAEQGHEEAKKLLEKA